MTTRVLVIALLAAWFSMPAAAHEIRPAYLEVREVAAGQFEVLWKTPTRGDLRLHLTPRFPAGCEPADSAIGHAVPGAFIERQRLVCPRGLTGQTIAVEGLEATLTDVLVRLELLDVSAQTMRLRPAKTSFVVSQTPSRAAVAGTYLVLGVEHIFGGIDHLLFVLTLLILIKGLRQLIATITAFTVAHSLTLGAATLGMVHLPSAPVEAVIALSILFLAAEITRGQQGRTRLTSSYPWIVAFAFGLLHGFGFAGALSEVGLPENAVPLALLFFNLGVEAGQLIFVLAMMTASFAFRRLDAWLPAIVQPAQIQTTAAYLIGTTAGFWTIQRIVSFWH